MLTNCTAGAGGGEAGRPPGWEVGGGRVQPRQIRSRRRPLAPAPADLRARVATWAEPAILGDDRPGGPAGRWTILAAEPREAFESATGRGYRLTTGGATTRHDGDALAGLAAWLARSGLDGFAARGLDEAVPFQGGAIGFLAYDLAPRIEAIPRRLDADGGVPALRFGLYDTFALLDHDRGAATLWAVDLLGEGPSALEGRLDAWSARLAGPPPPPPPPPSGSTRLGPVVAEQPRADYLARVERARQYIRAGDIFQVNLAQRFEARGPVDPLALDRRLRARCPAPYSAFLRWGDRAIVSASPELFFETAGRRIVTRPIKGTRPRSADPARDAELRADLLASAKEEAELTMIVDLERNDLGRVCEFGSVRVVDPRAVESYRNVHHTVATVEGRLRADVDPVAILRAMFPGGSITGAPKIRAMEIIDELEPSRRGAYTGSIGYWSANGRSTFNIAIRTAVVEPGRVHYHVGGGIVADSVPEHEYQETLDKGRGLLAALTDLGGPT